MIKKYDTKVGIYYFILPKSNSQQRRKALNTGEKNKNKTTTKLLLFNR